MSAQGSSDASHPEGLNYYKLEHSTSSGKAEMRYEGESAIMHGEVSRSNHQAESSAKPPGSESTLPSQYLSQETLKGAARNPGGTDWSSRDVHTMKASSTAMLASTIDTSVSQGEPPMRTAYLKLAGETAVAEPRMGSHSMLQETACGVLKINMPTLLVQAPSKLGGFQHVASVSTRTSRKHPATLDRCRVSTAS